METNRIELNKIESNQKKYKRTKYLKLVPKYMHTCQFISKCISSILLYTENYCFVLSALCLKPSKIEIMAFSQSQARPHKEYYFIENKNISSP